MLNDLNHELIHQLLWVTNFSAVKCAKQHHLWTVWALWNNVIQGTKTGYLLSGPWMPCSSVWIAGQLLRHHLGDLKKCRLPGPMPDLLNLHLNNIPWGFLCASMLRKPYNTATCWILSYEYKHIFLALEPKEITWDIKGKILMKDIKLN